MRTRPIGAGASEGKPDGADTPTVAEAKIIFATRPEVSTIHTTEGVLHRNGQLDPLPVRPGPQEQARIDDLDE